ncbi:MAG TPA: hypothetical protein VE093_28790 [Polyangiaceae bacterium]|nr:hypothetical protein [Polyangiaceae bacterium]
MRPLPARVLALAFCAAAAVSGCKTLARQESKTGSGDGKPAGAAPEGLKPVSAFASITDPAARSVALFTEAGRVITHPRCTNCHPPDKEGHERGRRREGRPTWARRRRRGSGMGGLDLAEGPLVARGDLGAGSAAGARGGPPVAGAARGAPQRGQRTARKA